MHDADSMRVIRPAGLLKYLHTASNEQLAVNYGLTEDEFRRRDTAFILSAMNVDIYKPIYMEEEIEVTTFAEISHGVKFGRTYEVRRGGELVALAHAQFALVRISDRSFVRVDELGHKTCENRGNDGSGEIHSSLQLHRQKQAYEQYMVCRYASFSRAGFLGRARLRLLHIISA